MSQDINPLPIVRDIVGFRNQPDGFVGIESNGDVLGTFASRRDTLANIASVVLAPGELAFTTDTKDVFVGDGVTAGGLFLYSTPKFISEAITATVAQSITILDVPTQDMFYVQDLSTGVYKYEFDLSVFSSQVYVNPSTWAFWVLSSSWSFNGSLPYPPGIRPNIKGYWHCTWNDGTINGGEFPYISYPLFFNGPQNATTQIVFGMRGKLTGLMYHERGPNGTVAQALPNSLVIIPGALSGTTENLTTNIHGTVQRIK